MSITLASGLTLVIPSPAAKNWQTSIQADCFQKISEHDHTGSGKGVKIAAAAIVDDALIDTKIRLQSGGWLRSRNAANSADLNLIRADASDNTEISAASSKETQFLTGGALTWTILSGGNIVPSANLTRDIGSLTLRIQDIYVGAVALKNEGGIVGRNAAGSANLTMMIIDSSDQKFYGDTVSAMILSGNDMYFRTNSVNRWLIDSDGHLKVLADATYNIGEDANRPSYIYASNLDVDNAIVSNEVYVTSLVQSGVINATTYMETIGLELRSTSEPGTPSGRGVLFYQSNSLKIKFPNGNVVTLASA